MITELATYMQMEVGDGMGLLRGSILLISTKEH